MIYCKRSTAILLIFCFSSFFVIPQPSLLNNTGDEYSYNLSKPVNTWELPKELKEISGLVKIDKNHFLAIEDLRPILYLVKTGNRGVIEKEIPFKQTKKDKFDIEDVAIAGNTVYTLWSHGELFRIKDWRTNPDVKKFETPLSKDNNTEGLCFDPVSGNLLIACKEKSDVKDEKKSTRSVWEFDLKKMELKKDPFLLIQKKDFKKAGYEDLDFYPSAIAVHPKTHNIYVLSTRENKCMAKFNYKGDLLSVQFIDKDLLPQPEGIYFSNDNRLYICSQGRKGNPAVIYEYKPESN